MKILQTILIVEDEPDIRELTRISLAEIGGFTIIDCSSGMEAIVALLSQKPDLIILDVMMPGMDGPDTYEKLKENTDTASIPVIFMTAKAQAHEVIHFKQLGAIGVVAKPFDPMTLPETVKQIWKEHHDG